MVISYIEPGRNRIFGHRPLRDEIFFLFYFNVYGNVNFCVNPFRIFNKEIGLPPEMTNIRPRSRVRTGPHYMGGHAAIPGRTISPLLAKSAETSAQPTGTGLTPSGMLRPPRRRGGTSQCKTGAISAGRSRLRKTTFPASCHSGRAIFLKHKLGRAGHEDMILFIPSDVQIPAQEMHRRSRPACPPGRQPTAAQAPKPQARSDRPLLPTRMSISGESGP